MSKSNNICAKFYTPKRSEEVFVIKKVKNTILWAYVIENLNGEENLETYYEKQLQQTNETELRVEKVTKMKGYKLHFKWKGYGNSFNSWIDKKDKINELKLS